MAITDVPFAAMTDLIEKLREELKDHALADTNTFKEINGKLDRILVQTTAHNGRLTKVEKYMYMCMGGLVIVGMIVVPLFINLISQ